MAEDAEVLFEERDGLGIITLNRPKALNALTLGMVLEIHPEMEQWADDDSIKAVVIVGEGDRGFCAGGDILWLRDNGLEDRPTAVGFYWDEYRLNRYIKNYPKPYIAFIDGITMGGGCGLSVHGDFRVATERTVYAMPETGIGLFPDVGGTYFMPRCPGKTGMYSALTGDRLKAADAVYLGIATHYVSSENVDAAIAALAAAEITDNASVAAVLDGLNEEAGQSDVELLQGQIDVAFAGDSVEEIMEALEISGSDWAQKTLKTLKTKSPTSVKITYRQMREGAEKDFDACMQMEYRIVSRVMAAHDFYEGVRAVIVDKDNAPNWQPAEFSAVTDEDVAAYFEPLGDQDLHFDSPVGTRA
jgi:enoyl-CoA hydratase